MINDFTSVRECDYRGEHYSVRDNGAVMRHSPASCRNRKCDNTWTFGRKGNGGYLFVSQHQVHRIVAYAFLGAPASDDMIVDHIDTNRCNNRPENLRWVTKLENALSNPITRKRITMLVGGDFNRFLEDPSCLRDLTGTNKDIAWMRTVSKDEAMFAYLRMMSWANDNKENHTPNKNSIGEWLFTKPKRQFDIPTSQHTFDVQSNNLIDSLTPNAVQKDWKTPTLFPLCPSSFVNPIDEYANNLHENAVFSADKYKSTRVYRFGVTANNTLIVLTESDNEQTKPWYLTEIEYSNDKFVHSNLGSFFKKAGAEKQFCMLLGLEWTGEDAIDNYC
ncbi:MAG: HNH endonuclease [Bacteroidales bacterium]|nr:HNH endonuclease [Bacteroidales bacterium]